MKRAYSSVIDHPSMVTITLVALVVVYWLASWFWLPQIAPSRLMCSVARADLPGALSGLALGVAGVAAMVGGFAGVVVVFGLSSNDERFRQVRLKASTSLRRNWMSIVTTPLVAAFGSIVAATLATATLTDAALWVLIGCVLLAAHGAFRLVVLLFELVKVVHRSDEIAQNGGDDSDSMRTADFYSD